LKDIETAIKWLCQRPYIDAKRVGMSGGSYGGFLTAYRPTDPKPFAAGIARPPGAHLPLFDSAFHQTYTQTPQENPDGYNKTSVVRAARDLHGKLLLAHGAMDDNVHVQNTLQFADALQRADKDFEMMIYPRSRHGGFGRHYTRLSLDFMRRVLRPEAVVMGKD